MDAPTRVALAAILLLAVLSGWVAVLATSADGQALLADESRIAIRAVRAAELHPLVGTGTTINQYTDANFDQPGPSQFYSMHLFVRAFGLTQGSWIYAVTLNLAALLVAVWAAFRQGGRFASLIVLLASLALYYIAAPGYSTSILNPRVVILPMLCVFFLAWAVGRGDAPMLPLLAGAASFVVQTHMGYALPVLASVGAGMAMFVWQRRNLAKRKGIARWILLSAVIVIGMWALPVRDQVSGSGNLYDILTTRLPGSGVAGAWHAFGSVFDFTSVFGGGQFDLVDLKAPAIRTAVSLALLALMMYFGRHRIRRQPELLVVTAAVVLGALLTAWVRPPLNDAVYHLYWVRVTSGFVLIAVAVSFTARPREDHTATPNGTRQWYALLLVLPLLALAFSSLWLPYRPTPIERNQMSAIRKLSREILQKARPGEQYFPMSRGGQTGAVVAVGVTAALFGENAVSRESGDRAGDGVLLFTVGHMASSAEGRLGARVLGSYEPADSDSAATERLSADLIKLISKHPPLLSESARSELFLLLDGQVPSLCLEQASESAHIAELSPETLVALFASGEVRSPVVEGDLLQRLNRWRSSMPIVVRHVPTREFDWTRSTPSMSEISC